MANLIRITLEKPRSYSAQPDNIKDFFRTGVSLNNSIGVEGGSEKMQTYLSYTNNKIQGIVPKNELTRHTVNLRVSNKITDKLSTDAKVTYIRQDISNKPRTGEENAPVIDMYQTPRSIGIDDVKNFETTNSFGLPIPTPWPATLSSIYQNPYWMIYRTNISEGRDRLMGFITATYKFSDWIGVTGRANLDKTIDQNSATYSVGTVLWASRAGGYFDKTKTTITQQWYDLAIHGEGALGPNFKLGYRAGGIFQDILLDQDYAQANGLNIDNKFSLGFASTPATSSRTDQTQTQSVFGQASLSFKESIFLEGSFRQEWDSRLEAPYRIPYFSIGLSGIVSDLIDLPSAISFLKVNGNYAQVGNGGLPQIRTNTYTYSQGAGHGFLTRTLTEAIPNLKPELVTSLEFGLDARFVQDRLGFTATFYKSNSKNQLLTLAQPVATGYSFKYINAGDIQNKGMEIILNGTPVKSQNFTWDVAFNLGINRNEIVELYADNPNLVAYLGGGNAYGRIGSAVVTKGGSFGDMYTKKWQRNDAGNLVVSAAGLPIATLDYQSIGSFNPKALLGLTNTFTYKRFSLRVLIDGRAGGVIIDGTEMNLSFNGITEATAAHRDDGWSLGGVGTDGNPVNQTITAQQFWSAGVNSTSGKRYGVGELYAYDATNYRIRELSIGFEIPVPPTFFIKSARFSLVARNLAWLYRGSSVFDIPGLGKRKMQIDPDMSLGNGNFQGIQYGTLPSTRSIGCNLNFTF